MVERGAISRPKGVGLPGSNQKEEVLIPHVPTADLNQNAKRE